MGAPKIQPQNTEKISLAQKRVMDFEKDFEGTTRHHEEGEGNWLMSYADMMTLLVGFFVMILSFSKPDPEIFEKVKQETSKLFGGEYQMPFAELTKKVNEEIAKQGLSDQVMLESNDKGLGITFRGALFFESGSIEMRTQAQGLLDKLIPIIKQQADGHKILIEGHTDDTAIHQGVIASNWELSGLRASLVLRRFLDGGFKPATMRSVGLADTQPVVPNRSPEGQMIPANQSQNRRVVIKILPDEN